MPSTEKVTGFSALAGGCPPGPRCEADGPVILVAVRPARPPVAAATPRRRATRATNDSLIRPRPPPISWSTTWARVRALARRLGAALPPLLSSGDITLDPSRRAATRAGRRLPLNPKELAVLEVLLSVDGAVVSAEEILQRVWDEFADPFSQAVRTTISRLRAKLGDPPVIETVPKAGYRICR